MKINKLPDLLIFTHLGIAALKKLPINIIYILFKSDNTK